jgi:hypothetical protein
MKTLTVTISLTETDYRILRKKLSDEQIKDLFQSAGERTLSAEISGIKFISRWLSSKKNNLITAVRQERSA